MIYTILGVLLFCAPFVGVLFFENRLKALLTIFVVENIVAMVVAVLLGLFHSLNYTTVIATCTVFTLLWYIYLWRYKKIQLKALKLDWYFIISILCIVGFLLNLHYHYSGFVDSYTGVHTVVASSYLYPFYSDEWVGVSLVDYSISSGSLATVNPLWENVYFPNYFVFFHALLTHWFLLFALSPLTQYVWFAVVNACFVASGVYLLLRSLSVSRFVSMISTFSLLFITNSGNLPGLLNLLPYTVSFGFVVLASIGFLKKDNVLFILSSVLSVMLYPPMILFVVLSLVGMALTESGLKRRRTSIFLGVLILCGLLLDYILDLHYLIFRQRLDSGFVSFQVWDVVPVYLLPFVIFGFSQLWKRRVFVILTPLIVALFFWILGCFSRTVFVLEQSRFVTIASIYLVMVAGVGISVVSQYIKSKYRDIFNRSFIKLLQFFSVLFVIMYAIFFNQLMLWHKLKLTVNIGEANSVLIPSPPVTRYLNESDIALFEGITGKRFIAPAWKGLVVGVATRNFPLQSKSSTITNNFLSYDKFLHVACDQKTEYAKKYNISFAYSEPFDCYNFKRIGINAEGLVLYKFTYFK